MSTIKTFIDENKLGQDPSSIKRRLQRNGHDGITINTELSEEILEKLKAWYLDQEKPAPTPPVKKPTNHNGHAVRKKSKTSAREILAVLPLPMLGLAASYGVYFFAAQFVPMWVAIAEAAAFELTYIGLAALHGLNEKQRKRASHISLGAVAVSMIYNSIAGGLHQDPNLLENLHRFWFWMISILHGAPLAILAYLIADLILHRK